MRDREIEKAKEAKQNMQLQENTESGEKLEKNVDKCRDFYSVCGYGIRIKEKENKSAGKISVLVWKNVSILLRKI